MVYRSLAGNLPSYLADDWRLIANARDRRLRSTENRTLCRYTDPHQLQWQCFCSCQTRTL